MTLTAANPGGWSLNELLTSVQMTALQNELLKAVDGVGGGTYTLGANLIFNGAEVRIGSLLRVLSGGSLTLDSGSVNLWSGSTTLQSSGTLTVAGTLTLSSSGLLSLSSGADIDMNSGSLLTLDAGADMNIVGDIHILSGGLIDVQTGGEISFDDADSLAFADTAYTWSQSLTPQSITWTGTEPAWQQAPTGRGWVDTQADGASTIVFSLPVLPGDTLTDVFVRLRGQVGVSGHALLPATPVFVILQSVDPDGNTTNIATASDPSLNPAAFNALHNIVLTGGSLPYTVPLTGTVENLIVVVRSEGGVGAEADKTVIRSLTGNGVQRGVRRAFEVN